MIGGRAIFTGDKSFVSVVVQGYRHGSDWELVCKTRSTSPLQTTPTAPFPLNLLV